MTGQNTATAAVEPWDDEAAPRALAWMPGVGESRIGTFKRWTMCTDRKGENRRVALFDGDDGQRYSLWVYGVVLVKEMDCASPQPGDRLKISRLVDRESARQRFYRVHRVEVLSRAVAVESDTNPLQPSPQGRDQTIPKGGN